MSRRSPTASLSVPTRLTVGELEFEVQLSARRRSIGITVDRDGSLIVNGPQDCTEQELVAYAQEKLLWVYKRLAEKALLLVPRPMKEFVTGEGFTYLGRSHRLLIREDLSQSVMLERGRLVMRRDIAESEGASGALVEWYRTRAVRWLPQRLHPWAERMGVRPSTIDVRDLGYRWGSQGNQNRINFHWATIQLAPSLIDYVIVHELAHIHEPNHTPAFWQCVEGAMPGYRAAKESLATTGSNVWLGERPEGSSQ